MKLVVCLLAIVAVATAAGVQERSFDNFGNIIKCLGKLNTVQGLMYANYGCFCGKGSVGNTPVDATDRCCQTHDNCYGNAVLPEVGCTAFETYTIDYDYAETTDASGNCVIQCKPEEEYDVNDKRARCKAFMCQCDLHGAQCFADERDTFSSWKYLNFTFWHRSRCVTV